MPLCGATFDENSVPPWTRGDFRGVLNAGSNPPRRSATAVAARHPSDGVDFPRSSHTVGVRCDVDKKNVGCDQLSDAAYPFARGTCPGGGAIKRRTHPTNFTCAIKKVTWRLPVDKGGT